MKFAGSTYSRVACARMCVCVGGRGSLLELSARMKRGWKPLRAVCWQGFDPPAHVKPRFQSYTHGKRERERENELVVGFTMKRGWKIRACGGHIGWRCRLAKLTNSINSQPGGGSFAPACLNEKALSRHASVVDTVPRFASPVTGPVDG